MLSVLTTCYWSCRWCAAGFASSPRMVERQWSFSLTCSGNFSFSLYLGKRQKLQVSCRLYTAAEHKFIQWWHIFHTWWFSPLETCRWCTTPQPGPPAETRRWTAPTPLHSLTADRKPDVHSLSYKNDFFVDVLKNIMFLYLPVTWDAHPTLGTNIDLTTFPVLWTRSCRTGELFFVRLAVVKSDPS